MNDFLNTVMNFINENTTLLIIICVFLIFVLIGYLIDNSVKSRKLAKKNAQAANNGVTVEETSVETPVKEQVSPIVDEVPTVEETPVVPVEEETVNEPVMPEPVEVQNTVEEELNKTVEVPTVEPLNDIKTTNFDDIDYEEEDIDITPDIKIDETVEPSTVPTEEISEPSSVEANEISIDPEINELLNRDFSKESENVNKVESDSASKLDELLLGQVKSVETPVAEEVKPVVEENSKYKNSKSLAEILASKKNPVKDELLSKEVEKNPELMNTVDFQNELDRILKKLNENSIDTESKDSTLDETTDFTDMF